MIGRIAAIVILLLAPAPSGRAQDAVEHAKSTWAVIHQLSVHHYRSAGDQHLLED